MQVRLTDFQDAIKNEGEKSYLIKIALLLMAYILAALFGLSLTFSVDQASAVWPATGIAITAILLWGYHYAPAIFIGSLLANVFNDSSPLLSTAIATGNTIEAVVAVLLIRRFVPTGEILEKISNFMAFLFIAVFFATALSATIGSLSLLAFGEITSHQFNTAWLTWWIGNVIGALLIVPLVVAWRNATYRSFIAENLFETVIILTVVATASFIVFSWPASSFDTLPPLLYLIFPLIIWAATRLTQIGAVSAGVLIAVAAIWGTLSGRGPHAYGNSTEDSLVFLHLFILVEMVTGIILAAAVSGRLRSEHLLREKAEELVVAKEKILHNVEWRKDLENQMHSATHQINDILGNIFEEEKRRKND